MKPSIHSRIIYSAVLILVLFMSLTGYVLDNAFRNNIKNLQYENLRTQIYALLAAADINDKGILQLPSNITEPRLNISESNLHARIITDTKKPIWKSKSMLNTTIPFSSKSMTGKFLFSEATYLNNKFTAVNFKTVWVTNHGEKTYIFQVAENTKALNSQINLFRKNLWLWLVGVSLLLIITQIIILRWGLKPLRHVAEDLVKIENGQTTCLKGDYPKEIIPLTNNLNQLLDSSQQQLTRYRDALGNMAHSLKTPIAVLQGIISNVERKDKHTALEQLHTINNIVDYQLQRAATASRRQLIQNTNVKIISDKILSSLQKVHLDKSIKLKIDMKSSATINIDQGDLYELLGNLLENAFKWCNCVVSLSVKPSNNKTAIIIEDDGPGINDVEKERILLRGQRADQSTPGHGLGLAMVSDILLIYEGSIEIVKSELGGAKIIVTI